MLYEVDSSQAARHVLGRDANEQRFQQLKVYIETLWHDDRCRFVQCRKCSFCFASPYVAADKRLYELVYDNAAVYHGWKWEYQVTLEALFGMTSCRRLTGFRLLEMGAGDGAFVKSICPRLVPKNDVLCTEYSYYGRNEIARYGIACLSSDVWDMDAAEYAGSFDVVCMFQVLEHLDHLDAFFECLTTLTKRQAHLFIAVPNAKHREFYDRHGFIEDIPPTHIGRWNKRSLEVIAGRHGWRITHHEIEPQSLTSKVSKFARVCLGKSNLMRQAQQIRVRVLRKAAKAAVLGGVMLRALPAIYQLTSPEMGLSQWVHLEKRCV